MSNVKHLMLYGFQPKEIACKTHEQIELVGIFN